MTKPRLDREDPALGSISPPFNGAHFFLHGHYFGVQGDYLFSDEGASAGAKEKAAPVASSDTPEAKKVPPAESEPVDLRAWAMKDKNYPFFAVKKAVSEQFPGAATTNTATIVAALVEAGVVTELEAVR
jgi:hypothetical protein